MSLHSVVKKKTFHFNRRIGGPNKRGVDKEKIFWSEDTPKELYSIGEKILKTEEVLNRLVEKVSREIYGGRRLGKVRILVVDLENHKMYGVRETLNGKYKVYVSDLTENSWIASNLKLSKAFTMSYGKPLYIKRDVFEKFIKGGLSESVYTVLHEALHKAGRIYGPSRDVMASIVWTEGANELITWKYLLTLCDSSDKVGEFVKEHSPYIWDALVVASVAKALGYRNVWNFIRDRAMKKIKETDMEKAVEKKIMKYLSKMYDKIPENMKKIDVHLKTKRLWLKKIRESIYSRDYILSSVEIEPPLGRKFLFKYAYDVLVNSFPKEFVEKLESKLFSI